jgi:hypothetical protein
MQAFLKKQVNDFVLRPRTHSRITGLLVLLLLVSVLFMNVAVMQSQQQLASMAAELESTSNSIATSEQAPTSGNYFPTNIIMTRAQLVSGDTSSLSSKDSDNLKIASKTEGNYKYIDWVADFTLPNNWVNNLSLNYTGKYSTTRAQYTYLYNYVTSVWDKVDYRTVGASIVNIELASIANPTKYVSPTGQLKIRIYCYSTVAFETYTDYLKIGATFSLKPIETKFGTPTPIPTQIPTPTLVLPTSPAISGEYYPTSIEVGRSQLMSGDFNSLKARDSNQLKAKTLATGSYKYLEWIADFDLPNNQINNLSLSYTGKYSTTRAQYIYLYNYKTSSWAKIDYRTVGASIVNIELASIKDPTSYVSQDGALRVKIYSYSTAAYEGYTDYLKIGVR